MPQRSRFEEFDIGRAVAILVLPIVHVLEEGDYLGVFPAGFAEGHLYLYILSALGAPLFMACMGANMVFTRHATPRELARRGVVLLIMGALLNLFRFGLPDMLFDTISGDYSTIDLWTYELAGCDIYDFSGLCFLAFALFKKLDLSPRQILLVAFASLIAGAHVLPAFFATPEDTYATRLLGRIFWVNENSCFPLLTWLSFPALGYAFGAWFKAAETDERRETGLRKMIPVAALTLAATTLCVALSGGDALLAFASPANDYITDLPNVLMVGSMLTFAAALAHILAIKLRGTRALSWFQSVSKRIIPYYACQWIVIGWVESAIEDLGYHGYFHLSEMTFWLTGIAVILISLRASSIWISLKNKLDRASR